MLNDDTASVQQNDLTPRTIPVLGNDVDPDGDTLSLVAVGPAQQGTAAGQADGTVQYLPPHPDLGFIGTDTFTYTASDGYLRATATVVVSVTEAPNSPPTALGDAATTDEDTPVTIDVLANDDDPDGDTLSVYSGFFIAPLSGTVTTTAGSTIIYTPNPDFYGADSFGYFASDGEAISLAFVAVTVNPVNDAPVVANDVGVIVQEDTPEIIDVLANDGDAEGDALLVVQVSQGDNGVVEIGKDADVVIYTPNPDFNGDDSFTYTASDGDLDDSGTVYVTVEPVNDAPRLQDDMVRAALTVSRTIAVLQNDSDPDAGDTLTLVGVGAPLSGTNSIDGDLIVYTPTTGISGTVDVFPYDVSDGTETSRAYVRVTVRDRPNHAPIASDDVATTSEDTPVTIDVLGGDDDPDGDPLFVAAVGDPPSGATSTDGSVIVYTPDTDFHGSDSFTYTVSDGSASATAAVDVDVTGVNDLPLAGADSAATMEETPVVIPVLDNDSDPDTGSIDPFNFYTLTVKALGSTPNGQLETDGEVITYTPALNYYSSPHSGPDTFTYTVNDGSESGDAIGFVTVTVTNINDPPAVDYYFDIVEFAALRSPHIITLTDFLNAKYSTPLSDPDCYRVSGVLTCPEGDELTIEAVGDGWYGTTELDPTGTVITHTPGMFFSLYNGNVFTYTVSDGWVSDTDFVVLLNFSWSILIPRMWVSGP
jgi:hypothetical protein